MKIIDYNEPRTDFKGLRYLILICIVLIVVLTIIIL